MKKLILSIAVTTGLILSACNAGVKKDLLSGLNITNNGLSVEDAYLSVGDKKISGSSVPYGSTVILTITGADGFTLKNGKAFPDAGITVKNKAGETVANLGGLFDEYATSGLDPREVSKGVTLSLTCQFPIKMNEEYFCEFILKDKNSKGEIKISNTLKMEMIAGTNYKPNGLTTDGIFYSKNNDKTTLNENTISAGDELNAYFSGLKGFKEENGMVWPDAVIDLQDMSGNSLIKFPDLFAGYDSTGVAVSDAEKLITLTLQTGDKTTPGKEYKAIFTIKDKKGSASLSDEFSFKVR